MVWVCLIEFQLGVFLHPLNLLVLCSYCSGLVASWQADMELSCPLREVSRVRASSGWGWLPILAKGLRARCLGLAAQPNRDRMTE